MDQPETSDLRRPLTLTLLALAVVGWVAAVWSFVDARSEQSHAADSMAVVRRQNELLATELKTERAAVGALSDVENRRTAVLGDIAAAQTSLHGAEQARDEARAQFKSTSDNLQQLTSQRSTLLQAVAQTTADLDAAKADLDTAIRRDGAIKRDSAQAENDLSAAKAQFSALVARRADVEKTVADATARAGAIARDVAAREAQSADLQRQIEEGQGKVEAAQAALPPLQAERAALQQALGQDQAARDTLNAEIGQLRADAAAAKADIATRQGEAARAIQAETDALAALQAKADALQASATESAERVTAAQAALDAITTLVKTQQETLKAANPTSAP